MIWPTSAPELDNAIGILNNQFQSQRRTEKDHWLEPAYLDAATGDGNPDIQR
jgi:hypothetical protein